MANKGKKAAYRSSPPLPYPGNKSVGRVRFLELLSNIKDGNNKTFIDLFGGSFYLSYLVHKTFPQAKIICNDYDNYLQRLQNIQSTIDLLKKIRAVVSENRYKKIIEGKETINEIIRNHESFIDLQTLATNLMYSAFNSTDIEQFLSHDFYNLLVRTEYSPVIEDYIEGIEFRTCDWLDLFTEFKDVENCIFIADPPLIKDNDKWKWSIDDTLKVFDVLKTNEFIYYCADKIGTYNFIKYLKYQANLLKDFKVVVYRKHPANKNSHENKDILLYCLDLENEVAEEIPPKPVKPPKEPKQPKEKKPRKVKRVIETTTETLDETLDETQLKKRKMKKKKQTEPFYEELPIDDDEEDEENEEELFSDIEEDSDDMFNEEEDEDENLYDAEDELIIE